jgi:probable HAF family extracellular repeat protein
VYNWLRVVFLVFALTFASNSVSIAGQVFTTISREGIVGTLVYTGVPNTFVSYVVIVTTPANRHFPAGSGFNGFDGNGEFNVSGLNMESLIFPPSWSDGTYTLYIFTNSDDFRNCRNNLVCTNYAYFTTFYRTEGIWTTDRIVAQRYSVTNLGDLPGGENESRATAINDNGEVVGTSSGDPNADYNGAGFRHATKPFLWTPDSGMQEIGISPLSTAVSGYAFGINDNGEVVGCLVYSGDGLDNRPFIWTASNGMQLLNNSIRSCATATNNNGQVTGTIGGSAFRWTVGGGIEQLGLIGFFTRASAINNNAEVAGNIAQARSLPVFWNAAGEIQNMDGLPYAFGSNTATGINDNREVVGGTFGDPTSIVFNEDDRRYAFFWSPTTGALDLGEFPSPSGNFSEARGINNSGQVVGGSNGHAFLWTAQDGMQDLNNMLDESSAGWTLAEANAINSSGQIVGLGHHNGVPRAFLLRPIAAPQPDTDGDTIPDATDNCPDIANSDQANFDNDSLGDACDPDDDNDGMPDTFETANGLDSNNAADAAQDADGDGLTNLEEFQSNINPQNPDSDGDGVSDGIEIAQGTIPSDPTSLPPPLIITNVSVFPSGGSPGDKVTQGVANTVRTTIMNTRGQSIPEGAQGLVGAFALDAQGRVIQSTAFEATLPLFAPAQQVTVDSPAGSPFTFLSTKTTHFQLLGAIWRAHQELGREAVYKTRQEVCSREG